MIGSWVSFVLRNLPFIKSNYVEYTALFMQKPEDKTLIFDDLEFCKIPLEELLEY